MAQVIQFPSDNVNRHSATVPPHRQAARVQQKDAFHQVPQSPTSHLRSRGLPKSRVSQLDSPWKPIHLESRNSSLTNPAAPTVERSPRIAPLATSRPLTSRLPGRSGNGSFTCPTDRYLPGRSSPVVKQRVLQVNSPASLQRIGRGPKPSPCLVGSAGDANITPEIMKWTALSLQPSPISLSTVGDKSGKSGAAEAVSCLLSECCYQGEMKVELMQFCHDLFEEPTLGEPTIEETPEQKPSTTHATAFASVFGKVDKVAEHKWNSESTAVASPEVAPTTPGSQITCYALSEPDSVESLPKPASDKLSSSPSYTSEQWKAFQELEQAEMTCEFRRLEIMLAEERSRTAQLQKVYTIELMAQKDAHTRDVNALEEMVGKVLAENKRLSGMVEQLCGKVQHGTKAWETPRLAGGKDQLGTATVLKAFLPLYANGACVLVEEKKNKWRVTNSQLKANTKGIGYRKRKDNSDRFGDSLFAKWEELVDGFDEGDGWIRCNAVVKAEEESDNSSASESQDQTSVWHKDAVLHSKGTSEADVSTASEHHVSSSSDDTLGGMKFVAWTPHSGMEAGTLPLYTNVD